MKPILLAHFYQKLHALNDDQVDEEVKRETLDNKTNTTNWKQNH